MGFYEMAKKVTDEEKVLTDNGAVAYHTSGKEILDFNFDVSAMRGMSEQEIMDRFAKVYYENKEVAILYIFYLGDIRGGLGERHAFRSCMKFLCLEQPNVAWEVLSLIPYYNRWDSLFEFLEIPVLRQEALSEIRVQLEEDVINAEKGKSISLLAKWLPSINTSSAKSRKLAKIICNDIGWSEKQYRKTISALRKYLDVVEYKMSANQWGDIKYESVPSKANLIYKKAFLRHDQTRRKQYLDALAKGEVKINASVVNPHEIVCKYGYDLLFGEDEVLESMWKALPQYGCKNVLVIRDGSGSMKKMVPKGTTSCLDVATALAIYTAEHNTGEWKDKFITFSSRPRIVNMEHCEALRDKISMCYKYTDWDDTNIYKTMRLVLDTAVKNHLKKDEMPEMILIISDMQFNGMCMGFSASLFDKISEEFKDAGYDLPRICFWNVNAVSDKGVPMQQNKNGLILCSGFSLGIMNMFLSNKIDPYEVLLDTLYGDRYKPVLDALNQ